ncbi:twitching motility protein PilT [Spirochaetia bacterium]|nr:twitching motility protein PilT [Spirochaetia bacterium]
MKNITIDLNIILDFLFKREGHEKAAELLKYCANNKAKGYLCAHEITTLSYFLEKNVKDRNKIKKTISRIMKRYEIIEINKNILNNALLSEINDFEDAVIVESSKLNDIDYIITKNTKHFNKSTIKTLTPEEFIALK